MCQAKRLLDVHLNREHSNQPMNQWSQNINKTDFPGLWVFCVIFLFLSFITAFQLLQYSYYNPYNASALINAPNCFSENKVFFFLNCMNCFIG